MKIKDIEQIVKDQVGITDEELDDIDRKTNYNRILTKVKPKVVTTEYNTIDNHNEYGYRSDSFDGDDGFVFLGCSLTDGYALEEHETWPWIVGKHFDVKVWNLAQGARGDDVCFMNTKRWIPKLKPKVVCMLMPPPGRFQFFDYDYKKLFKEFNLNYLPKKPKFPWLFNPKHLYLSSLKNLLGIKSICDEHNIPFIVKSSDSPGHGGPPGHWERVYDDDTARDESHPGPKWQKRVSKLFIKEIEKCI